MRVPLPIRRTLGAITVVLLLASGEAAANGRFPSGGYLVVGPGATHGLIAVRATFGILTSRDDGRTWGWTCEDALATTGMFDASIAIAFDGSIVATTPRGLTRTRDGCAWTAPPGSPGRPVVDISHDAAARNFVTAAGPSGTDDALLRSDDGGASWTTGALLPGLYTQTVEVAPSAAMRVYVSGFLADGTPVLLRSDDGGRSAREVSRGEAFLGGTSAFVSAVDPTNPEVLYVRSADGLGTLLLRSDDGGASFRRLGRTASEMTGFALSDDGETVWMGSRDPHEGILRAHHGGPFVHTAATISVRCLRQHAGILYVCADELSDGFMVGCSRDGGEHVEPLLSARRLTGPPLACAASSPVASVCGPLWPAQRDLLQAIDASAPPTADPSCGIDAAVSDERSPDPDLGHLPVDVSISDMGAVLRDSGGSIDGGARLSANPGCACGASGGHMGAGAMPVLAFLAFARRRRRLQIP